VVISSGLRYLFHSVLPHHLVLCPLCHHPPPPLRHIRLNFTYKDGDQNIFTNYRPISVLPCFSKFFEKAIYNRLWVFLESKSILINQQYGFREYYSTYMDVMNMYDGVSTAIDRKEFAIGIFIDLSKAFDSLNHKIILQ